jgi:hypothetical protein
MGYFDVPEIILRPVYYNFLLWVIKRNKTRFVVLLWLPFLLREIRAFHKEEDLDYAYG